MSTTPGEAAVQPLLEDVEKFDSAEELEQKVNKLAQWVRESKHLVVFTGAGISTEAGLSWLSVC